MGFSREADPGRSGQPRAGVKMTLSAAGESGPRPRSRQGRGSSVQPSPATGCSSVPVWRGHACSALPGAFLPSRRLSVPRRSA